MNNSFKRFRWFVVPMLIIALMVGGCKKSSSTGPDTDIPTYPVTAKVLDPQGYPLGGATLTLLNPPFEDPKFTSLTDSTGKATIQSPAGQQTLIAKFGTVFEGTLNVTVAASSTPTIVTTPIQVHQNTSLGKVLVVLASAEKLEDVLHAIGYTTFDSISVDALRDSAAIDSTKLLQYLKQYKLVFSDCNGGDEYQYPLLARVYGRYVTGGGKIYGGHYNYYILQFIWPPYFTHRDYQGDALTDTLKIVDNNLQKAVGTFLDWTQSEDSRHLSGYQKFSDLPPAPVSHTYGVIKGTNPEVGVIVECYPNPNPNGGKYLWTDYHNQDILNNTKLLKIVTYFLNGM